MRTWHKKHFTGILSWHFYMARYFLLESVILIVTEV